MSLTITGPASGIFYADNHYIWQFTVTILGVPVDITNMDCRFIMVRGSTTELTTEGVGANVTVNKNAPVTGEWQAIAADEDTLGLIGTYRYQAQVEDASGAKSNILYGYFTFKENLFSAPATT